MNKKMTGTVEDPLTYHALIEALVKVIRENVDGYVFIETGIRWKEAVREQISSSVFNIKEYTLTYKSGSKTYENILLAGTTRPDLHYENELNGLLDYESVPRAIAPIAKEGEVILDPFCGMGNTAKAALEYKMVFCGNELNLARLQKTIQKLSV